MAAGAGYRRMTGYISSSDALQFDDRIGPISIFRDADGKPLRSLPRSFVLQKMPDGFTNRVRICIRWNHSSGTKRLNACRVEKLVASERKAEQWQPMRKGHHDGAEPRVRDDERRQREELIVRNELNDPDVAGRFQ